MKKEKQVEVTRCVLCGEMTDSIFNIKLMTDSIFNIKFKMVFICDSCADTVTLQNVQELTHRRREGFEVM